MIFNELEYAKKMLVKGFIGDRYTMELKILAKYYNKKYGLKTDAIKSKLKDFCIKYLPKYNEVLHLEMITKASKYGVQKKNTLMKIPPIPITKSELDKIESLNDIKLETIAFTALVLSKIDKYRPKKKNNKKNEYHCNNLQEMFINSKVRSDKEQREDYIRRLSETELFDLTVFATLKINFVDESEEPELRICKYENFVLEYLSYKGENVEDCIVCCTPFLPTNNFQRYCKICAKDIEKENHKDRNREHMRKKRSVDEGENPANASEASVLSIQCESVYMNIIETQTQ